MHLTTPSLEIQVTGEYTVKTVKSTREILKDAVSSFQTQPSAQPALPYSAPSPPNSPQELEAAVPVPAQPQDPSCSQGWREAAGCPTPPRVAGDPAAGSKKHQGLSQSLLGGGAEAAPAGQFGRGPKGNRQAGGQTLTGNTGGQALSTWTAFTPQGTAGPTTSARQGRGAGTIPLQGIAAKQHFENTSASLTSNRTPPAFLPSPRAAFPSSPSGQHTELAHSHPAPQLIAEQSLLPPKYPSRDCSR